MADGEITGELDAGDILNICIEVLGDAISVDMGEEIWWLDRGTSSAKLGGVVRGGD